MSHLLFFTKYPVREYFPIFAYFFLNSSRSGNFLLQYLGCISTLQGLLCFYLEIYFVFDTYRLYFVCDFYTHKLYFALLVQHFCCTFY